MKHLIQFGESVTGDLKNSTWTFEVENLKLMPGEYAIVPKENYIQLIKALKSCAMSLQAHPDNLPNSEFEGFASNAWIALDGVTTCAETNIETVNRVIKSNSIIHFPVSVFLSEKKGKEKWIKEHHFYHGNLSTVTLNLDWRFKEIPNKRKESVFLGLVEIEFPIKYPLVLTNGETLHKI